MANMLAILSGLCLVSTAFAIQCYECDSSKNIACNVGILSFAQKVTDCSARGDSSSVTGFLNSIIPHNCIKLVAKDDNGNEYVARGCGVSTGPVNVCQAVATSYGFMSTQGSPKDLQCFTCDTDKCNGATSVGGMAILSVLAACFVYLL